MHFPDNLNFQLITQKSVVVLVGRGVKAVCDTLIFQACISNMTLEATLFDINTSTEYGLPDLPHNQ